jgi:putative ABC transport system permease protein
VSRRKLFFRLVMKDAWVRKDRAFTALLSVAVVATMATVALTIYYDLEGKLSREFRSFGANVVVTKANGSLTADELAKIDAVVGSKGEVVPVSYAIATMLSGQKIVVGGADIDKLLKMNSWWSLTGRGKSDALIGTRANDIVPAGPVRLSFAGVSEQVVPGTVIRSGSEDDDRIYISRDALFKWTGVRPSTALVRMDGRPQEIQNAISQLRSFLPQVDVQPVRQITQTQTAVLGRTRSIVLAASIVVVVLIMLCMVATFTSAVLERRKDFAVMKALGASNKAVNLLFASESALLALIGGIAGFLAGSGVAYWIGKVNFEAAIPPQINLVLPVLLGSIALALLAAMSPIRMLQRIQPAQILRGE